MPPSEPVEDLPADIAGERKALQELVRETQAHLEDRHALGDTIRPVFDTLDRELDEGPFTHTHFDSVRERLGNAVDQAASEYFTEGDFIVWPRHRWDDVGPHDWPAATQQASVKLPVSMACEAYGSQSVLLTNTRDRSVRIEVEIQRPATGPGIVLRRGWHVSCPDSRYRADALILLADSALTLAPGETTCLWVQVDSHGCDPGRFPTPITLRSKETTVVVETEVEVFQVALPEVLECTLFNFDYVNDMGLVKNLVQEAMVDLRQHFINTFIVCDSIPEVEADREGNLITPIDFSVVDQGVQTYCDDARLIGFFWGADINTSLGKRLFPELEFLSGPWRKATVALYEAWIEHLKEMGLTPDRYFMHVYDETTNPDVQQVYALLKETAPNVRLLIDPTTGYRRDELEAIAEHVDIWMPSYEALVGPHPEDFEFLKSTGKTLWVYSCANGTPMPLYDYYLRRHWVGWNLGVTGISQWAYADHGGWDSSNSWDWVRGAFATIYTLSNAPDGLETEEPIIPSKRWDAWREGAQDFQLLTMAGAAATSGSAAQSNVIAQALEQAVSLVVDHPEDPDAADRARAILLRVLSEAN